MPWPTWSSTSVSSTFPSASAVNPLVAITRPLRSGCVASYPLSRTATFTPLPVTPASQAAGAPICGTLRSRFGLDPAVQPDLLDGRRPGRYAAWRLRAVDPVCPQIAGLRTLLADRDGVDQRHLALHLVPSGSAERAARALPVVLDQQGQPRRRLVVEAERRQQRDVEQPLIDDARGDQRNGVQRDDDCWPCQATLWKAIPRRAPCAGATFVGRCRRGRGSDHLVAGDQGDAQRRGRAYRQSGRQGLRCERVEPTTEGRPGDAGYQGGDGTVATPVFGSGQGSPLRKGGSGRVERDGPARMVGPDGRGVQRVCAGGRVGRLVRPAGLEHDGHAGPFAPRRSGLSSRPSTDR